MDDRVLKAGQAIEIQARRPLSLMHLQSWLPAAMPHPVEIPSIAARYRRLSPREWLIVSESMDPPMLRDAFNSTKSTGDFSIADMTHGYCVFRVNGAASRELLSRGCGVDMHERTFPREHCVRTRFAQIRVIIDCLDAAPTFDLYASRSYRAYLEDWLRDAIAGL
jgi:heterotetrameric sarcosine oxidase gamma subunit